MKSLKFPAKRNIEWRGIQHFDEKRKNKQAPEKSRRRTENEMEIMKVSGVPKCKQIWIHSIWENIERGEQPVNLNTKTLQSCLTHAPTKRRGNLWKRSHKTKGIIHSLTSILPTDDHPVSWTLGTTNQRWYP